MSERKSINLLLNRPPVKATKKPSPRATPVILFAYGGIMHRDLVAGRGIRAEVIGIAKLPGHKISFHGYTQIWDGAEETAVAAEGHDLYGVLYKLSGLEADRLDAAHGVRLNGTGTYYHYPVEVVTMDGETMKVVMYQKAALRDARPPSDEYLRAIVEAATGHGLPQSYIDELKKTRTVPASYPVPLWPAGGPHAPEPCDC